MRLPRRHPIRLELQLAVEVMGKLLSLAVNLASPKPKSFGAKPMTIGRTSSAGGNIALAVFKGNQSNFTLSRSNLMEIHAEHTRTHRRQCCLCPTLHRLRANPKVFAREEAKPFGGLTVSWIQTIKIFLCTWKIRLVLSAVLYNTIIRASEFFNWTKRSSMCCSPCSSSISS